MKRTLLLALLNCCAIARGAQADSLAEVQEAYKAGRTGEAMRRLDVLIASRPSDARFRFQKGVMLVDQKRPNDAIPVFQKLVQDYPSLPEPLNNLAVLYVERGDMEKARTTLEAAIRSKPNYGTAFQNLGDLYTRMASRAYARALQIDDADGAPKLALIRNLYEQPETGLNDTLVAQAPAAPRPLPTPAVPATPSAPSAPIASKPAAVVVAAASAASPVTRTGPGPATSASAPTRTAAAATASAPAAVRPPKPTPPAPTTAQAAAAEDAEVIAAVRGWASAWSRRDLNAYFAAYAPGFKGSDASSDAWQAARRVRILGKSAIKVEVSAIKVDVDKAVAKASFRQAYTAGALEVSSRKTLEFMRSGNKWLIKRESVGG